VFKEKPVHINLSKLNPSLLSGKKVKLKLTEKAKNDIKLVVILGSVFIIWGMVWVEIAEALFN
jgi:hypothetical protein